jgi:hypothetical protein
VSYGKGLTQNELNYRSSSTDELILLRYLLISNGPLTQQKDQQTSAHKVYGLITNARRGLTDHEY